MLHAQVTDAAKADSGSRPPTPQMGRTPPVMLGGVGHRLPPVAAVRGGASPGLRPSQAGLVLRRCACGGIPGPTGECTSCRAARLQRSNPTTAGRLQLTGPQLQRKPEVNAPGDRYEREADEVAGAVMRTNQPAAVSSAPRTIQRECTACAEEQKGRIQTHPIPLAFRDATPDTTAAARAATGNGGPLPGETRRDFEQRFGYDFGDVRIHTGDEAARAARGVQARAYTIGRDIVFGSGEYVPGTMDGKRLLAHELAHVVQQGGAGARPIAARSTPSIGVSAGPRSTAVPSLSPTNIRIARKDDDGLSAGSTVGYVAIYLGGDNPDNAVIDFHTKDGMFRYHLEDLGDLKPGEYQSKAEVKGNDVEFTLDVASGDLFNFRYRIDPGQPNPRTFFAHQSAVTFTVVADEPPELHKPQETETEEKDPDVTYLSVEEALRRCASNDLPGVKVFPFRGTRAGAAPLTVFQDGKDIVVKSYVYVLANDDFKAQTRTLPTETFIGGVHLKPNEVVRVHTYEPRWYHLNITGSTSGDKEDEFCVSGEQMLKIGEMSDRAVVGNVILTAIDAATLFLPVGKLASFLGKPVVQFAARSGRVLAAAVMLGLRDAAPTAFAGIASRTGTVLVEEQIVDQIASRAVSETAAHALLEFSEQSLATAATKAVGEAAVDVGTSAAAPAVARTVTVTVVDAAGHRVVSKVTTPTGDAALDKAINDAFNATFDTATSDTAGAAAGQGVVSAAPEITAGFTQAQVTAFRRILAKSFDTDDIKILQQLWDAAARPGDAGLLNAANSRYLFDLQRNRFWSRVAANPQARALFEDAGCKFSGGAPYYVLNGRRITITIDHIVERQTAPNLALTATNLRLAFSRENSVVLRLLNQLDPFQ